jgi:hypothetical protein
VLALLAGCALAVAPPRPTLSGPDEAAGSPGGHFLLHFTRTGADAVDPTDTDPQNGVPDLVDDYASGLDAMWERLAAAGWPPPPADDGAGGDDRLDAYLRELPASGGTRAEPGAAGPAPSYIELATSGTQLGRAAARAVAAREAQHAFGLALTTTLDPWIYQATATWEAEALYDQPELAAPRQALWAERLAGAARPLGESDGIFEQAGMIWLKFLVDDRGSEADLLELWRHMAAAGDVRRGHDVALAPRFAGGIAEAAARFHLWNLFACQRDDGRHYSPRVGCQATASVPTELVARYPSPTRSSQPVGPLGARYLALTPVCKNARAQVHLEVDDTDWRLALLLRQSGRSQESILPLGGLSYDVAVAFSGLIEADLVVVRTGATAGGFRYSATAEGSYAPPDDPGALQSIILEPAPPGSLRVGDAAEFVVRGHFGACDTADLTAEASFVSDHPEVASFTAGVLRARRIGTARLSARARGLEISAAVVVGPPLPDGGCAATGLPGGARPGWSLAALAALAATVRRWVRGRGRGASSRP